MPPGPLFPVVEQPAEFGEWLYKIRLFIKKFLMNLYICKYASSTNWKGNSCFRFEHVLFGSSLMLHQTSDLSRCVARRLFGEQAARRA